MAEEEDFETVSNAEILAVVAVVLMLVVVTVAFEKTKEHALHHTDKLMRPIIEALFGEMTILGFVSAVAFVLNQSGVFGKLSERLFGLEEEFLEIFEMAHYAIFFIMIAFCVDVIFMVREGMRMIVSGWKRMEQYANEGALRALVPDSTVIPSLLRPHFVFPLKRDRYFESEALFYAGLRREFLLDSTAA